jgi:hypothetical protein
MTCTFTSKDLIFNLEDEARAGKKIEHRLIVIN